MGIKLCKLNYLIKIADSGDRDVRENVGSGSEARKDL